MAMTKDQLRAARVLLHLEQPELAEKAKMGVATLRRFEGGANIREIYVDALQRVIEEEGVILITGQAGDEVLSECVGVALRPTAALPQSTLERMGLRLAKPVPNAARAKLSTSPLPAAERAPPNKGGKATATPSMGTISVKSVPRGRGRPRKLKGSE